LLLGQTFLPSPLARFLDAAQSTDRCQLTAYLLDQMRFEPLKIGLPPALLQRTHPFGSALRETLLLFVFPWDVAHSNSVY